ncbi:MAG: LysM peptidoglycan-binding domain-containing protein [Syntrophales bacterium]|jgi:nucleoid-associated protein YgaU|nr:LysM peptidoglycan-binding domain-containing protein [Syntrophales bacterium]
MNSSARIAIALLFFLIAAPCPQGHCAKEETAHMTFKTTAVSKDRTNTHIVKKGEWLMDILRKRLPNIEHRLTILRQFNPHLKDLDRILPGQKLILPALEGAEAPVKEKQDSESLPYLVKPGDSLTAIIVYEMRVAPDETLKTLRILKALNPGVADFNRLEAGQILSLPKGSLPLAARVVLPEAAPQAKTETPLIPKILTSREQTDLVAQIIARMNGSVQTVGTHFIPLPQVGQLSVDCSRIPLVEFQDGSIVLVDFDDRIPSDIKKVIEESWKNYHWIVPKKSQGVFALLRQIVQSSATYAFEKGDKPQRVESSPELRLAADWFIRKKTGAGEKPFLQALLTLRDTAKPLPAGTAAFLAKRGVVWTEIRDGKIVPPEKEASAEPAQVPTIFAGSAKDLLNVLLTNLDYPVSRDTDIRIFSAEKDGFNLSVKGDLLVKAGETSLLVHHRRLPEQFTNILRERAYRIVIIDPEESKRTAVEKTFRALAVPIAFDRFPFPLDADGRIVTTFPALEILHSGGPLYLVDFDLDRDLYGILRRMKDAAIIRY